MAPKVEAALSFLRAATSADATAVITSPERLLDAVRGEAGTRIVR